MTPSIARSFGTMSAPTAAASVGKEIDLVHDLVRDAARGNAARPADDARRADAALHHACCRSRSTGPDEPRHGRRCFGAVVGAPEHDRVARDAQPIDRVEHAARRCASTSAIASPMSPAPVLPAKSGCGERREVDLRDRVVEEERLLRLHAALHERDAALRRFAIDGPARVQVERLHVARRRAGLALPDERRARRRLSLRDRRLRFVARARNAVELVEALMRRLALALGRIAAEMPLAEEAPSRSRPTSAPRRS